MSYSWEWPLCFWISKPKIRKELGFLIFIDMNPNDNNNNQTTKMEWKNIYKKCKVLWPMKNVYKFPVYVSMLWEKKIVYILYLISYVQCSCWLSLLIHCLLKSLRTFYLRKTLAQKLWNVHVTKYGDHCSQLSTGSNCWVTLVNCGGLGKEEGVFFIFIVFLSPFGSFWNSGWWNHGEIDWNVADGFWNHFLEISWKFLDLILVIVAVATRMSRTSWNRGKNWRQIMVSCSKWA